MTATTEATTVVEHGVRYTWPGETTPRVTGCDDLDCAHAVMDTLAGQGVTIMEPVTRAVPEWSVDPAGLPAAVRHLAEAYADNQLAEAAVGVRLTDWLGSEDMPGRAKEFWRVVVAIRAHREAEDGPLPEDADREALVAAQEHRIDEALRRIVGVDL
jgi:hypothetical protein